MSQLTKIWRWNDSLSMQDTELIIDGQIVINSVPYIKATFTKHSITQEISVKVYENEEAFLEMYSTKNGWTNYFLRIWEFKTPVEVPTEVLAFVEQNAIQYEPVKAATIIYDDTELFTLGPDKTGTLDCRSRVMKTNLQIKTPPLAYAAVVPTEEEQQIFPPYGYGGFDSFTVNSIPSQYIVPKDTIEIVENNEYDVTKYAKAHVTVPDPPSSELVVTPKPDPQECLPPTGQYYNKVSVEPIPKEYLIPEGDIVIEENVVKKDIAKYATVTVNALEAVKGKTYECIAALDVEAGQFVEFLTSYGGGNFLTESVTDIKVYPVSYETVLIDYMTAAKVRNIIGLFVIGNNIYISEPVSYGTENTYKYDLAVLNDNRVACLWAVKDSFNGQEQCAVYISCLDITLDYEGGISLAQKSPHLVYSGNINATIEGPSLSKITSNSVLVTMLDKSADMGSLHYSVIKNINTLGSWTTGAWSEVGYDYTNNNQTFALGDNKVLCVWQEDDKLTCGILHIDKNAIVANSTVTINNVSTFIVKELTSKSFALLTKNRDNELEIRTINIGGTTVTPTSSLILAVDVQGAIGLAPLTSTRSLVLYQNSEGSLSAKFIYHESSSIGEIQNANPSSLNEIKIRESFDLSCLSQYNNLIAYNDEFGESKYGQLLTASGVGNTLTVVVKKDTSGIYVYPATSNDAIMGVTKFAAKTLEQVSVVRPF